MTTLVRQAPSGGMSVARVALRMILVAAFMLSLSVAFLMVTTPAFAAVADSPAAPVTIQQLTPQMVAGLLGALIPLLVSLLARSGASDTVKVWLNIVLTAALGAVAALVVVNPATGVAEFGWVPFLTAWLYAFVTSTITYLGALKNFAVNDILLAVGGLFGQKLDPNAELGEHEGLDLNYAENGHPTVDPTAADPDIKAPIEPPGSQDS